MLGWGRSTWHFDIGFNMMVDFSIWILQLDGLRVPPFDRHPEGNRVLRSRGLDEAGWRGWEKQVVSAQAELATRLKQSSSDAKREALRDLLPPALWSGTPNVGDMLATLWFEYGRLSNKRKDPSYLLPATQSEDLMELRSSLEPYWDRLPALHVYLVDYPGPAIETVRPGSLIVGIRSWYPNAAELTKTIFDGAVALAAPDHPA